MIRTYDDLCSTMIQRLPQLSSQYEELLTTFAPDAPGPHLTYGILSEALLAEPPIIELPVAMALLEEMATHADQEIRNVVGATILFKVVRPEYTESISRIRRFMGPATLELARASAREMVPEVALKCLAALR